MNLQPVDFKAVAAKGAYVYCYLREDERTPYYVGISTLSDGRRPFQEHSCQLPAYDALIRVMRSGLTKEEAQNWEIYYIARFGRKRDGGLLHNQNFGGEGNWGYSHTEETKRHLRSACGHGGKVVQMQATAKRYGADANEYLAMGYKDRQAFRKWERRNQGGTLRQWRNTSQAEASKQGATQRSMAAAAKAGVPFDEWEQLTPTQRTSFKSWKDRNRGKTYFDWKNRSIYNNGLGSIQQKARAAHAHGCSFAEWNGLTRQERNSFHMWQRVDASRTLRAWRKMRAAQKRSPEGLQFA